MRPYSLPFGGWVYRRRGAGSLEVSRFSLFYTHKLRICTRFQGVSLRSELVNLAGPYITRRKQSARQQCPSFSFPCAPSRVPCLVFFCLPFSCLVPSCPFLVSLLVVLCSFSRLLFLSLVLSSRVPCPFAFLAACLPSSCVLLCSFCVSFCLLSLLLPVCFSVGALCASLRLVFHRAAVPVWVCCWCVFVCCRLPPIL